MSAIVILKKKAPKNRNVSFFKKDCYLVIGGPIDMNVGMF